MTVIVGVTTPDGVVLAADSRTTRIDGERHRIVSDSAQKLFVVEERFGIATAGFAFIGSDTIAGVMDRCLAQLSDEDRADVDAFTDAVGNFFHEQFMAWLPEWDIEERGYAVEFLIAGYDAEGVGHIHEVRVPGPQRGTYSSNTVDHGTMWRGQTDVIGRLLKGVDRLGLALSGPALPAKHQKRLDGLEYLTIFPITVSDALDYATFLIRTTIDMQRFSDGTFALPGLVPSCGGPIRRLTIDRDGARWAPEA